MTDFEMELFGLFLTQNLKNSNPAARQEITNPVARFLLRLCDATRRLVNIALLFIYISFHFISF